MGADKNKYGQYFTIEPIAEFMTGLVGHTTKAKVLEPSCGEGVFLKALAQAGFNNIQAYEIDKSLAGSFDCVKYQSFVSSPLNEKYDVVIGNPPYIRWKNLEQELKDELMTNSLWQTYFNSLCDYLFIFILKSIEQLAENGELIFICTEYWLNTTHSASLRNYMCAHGYITDIYHFKEAPLFHGVTASFIIFRYIKNDSSSKPNIVLHKYNKRGTPTIELLNSPDCFNSETIPQFESNRRWLLAKKEVQNEMEQFENTCKCSDGGLFGEKTIKRLGEVCEIGNGMVSGMDSAFNVTSLSDLNKHEEHALINVLKAKDLSQFIYNGESKYFFLPEDLSQEEFQTLYPHFYEHIKPYIGGLHQRYSYNRNIPYWSFAFPRNKKMFEQNIQKIFIPCKERISHKRYFRFCLAPEGCYPLQDVTGIVKKHNCKESIEYILYFLNSQFVFNWLTHNGIIKGAIVEFSEAPIASIPYRAINWDKPEEVAIHDLITKKVRESINSRATSNLQDVLPAFKKLFR